MRIGARRAAAVGAVAAAIAAGAELGVAIPGTEIPQTAQTLVIVLAGFLFGAVVGSLGAALYLALGAAGLPVFAAGSSGLDRLIGPSAGYLVGFVFAAAIAGWWGSRRNVHPALRWFLAGLLAHAVILLLGSSRLALVVGASRAYELGVEPFLFGAVAKSALASAVAWFMERRFTALPLWAIRDD